MTKQAENIEEGTGSVSSIAHAVCYVREQCYAHSRQ
jgi:hypothetical protein